MKQLFAIALLFFPVVCFAQMTISGKVLNQADTKPIPDASVFLSNSSVGAKTADDGTFNLKNVKPGKYQLIISIIGFETFHQTITVENSNITLPVIKLLTKTMLLNEVAIRRPATDADRDRDYERFKDDFLGKSTVAHECKILNPEVIDLAYNKRTTTLTASSEGFLKIENNALGYDINYLLVDFSDENKTIGPEKTAFSPSVLYEGMKTIDSDKTAFSGSVLFKEMKGTAAMEKRWQRNRIQVYEGSPMHFLRTALNNTFNEEGFQVFCAITTANPQRPSDTLIMDRIKFYRNTEDKNHLYKDSLNYWQRKLKLPKTIKTYKRLNQSDFIKLTDIKGVFALSGNNGALFILFNKNHHPANIKSDDLNNEGETIVYFNFPYALFDKNGVFTDPNSLTFKGAWANNRLAQLLPVNYEPFQNALGDTSGLASPRIIAENISAVSGSLKIQLLKSDSINRNISHEKFYLLSDKPYYAVGDTIWFKAYLLNDLLTPSNKSGILNIDIANDSDKVVRKYRLPVQSGLAWGEIALEDKYFGTGTYTLRAYTNWMQNFGDDAYFYKTFAISSANGSQLLVNSSLAVTTKKDSLLVTGKLLFANAEKIPFAAQPVTLRISSGNKSLYHAKTITSADGAVGLGFSLQNVFNPALIVENNKRERLAVIPLALNRPQNADVQFLPEGGSMVAGLPAHIGFKAISEDGKGTDVYGVIVDQDNKQAATFKSLHNGMGSFDLDIKAGETYTAQITLPDGSVKLYPLPPVKTAGTTLSIKNEAASDSLRLTIDASRNAALSGESYYLIARSRGIVCYAAVVNFNGGAIKRSIAKSLFPTGVTHFTLMTTKNQPVNERLVFIDHHDDLDVKISTSKPYYGARDSVALKLKITDEDGDPVSADVSVVVTDDAQVKAVPNTENIATHFLLTSDLKGYIEQPAYYLSTTTNEAWQALDNLLLTQGWVGYNWSDVFNPSAPVFEPETELAVTGHVTNVLNKPVKGTDILLFSKKPSILIDTATDSNGRFVFDRFPKIDTPIFVLKTVNKNGKSFNVLINVDEVKPPGFIKPARPSLMPWYVNSDSTLLNYAKTAALIKQQENFTMSGHVLKEVKISAKKIIHDSQNLNGPGNADFVLDEKDLEAAGKKTWLQVLRETLKGFRVSDVDSGWSFIQDVKNPITGVVGIHQWYFINDKPVKFYIDGISLTDVYHNSDRDIISYSGCFINTTSYLDATSAEDIKGIEVNTSDKYTGVYYNTTVGSLLGDINPDDIAFIEITTRSGHGPVTGNTPGIYLYKPLPISWPKQFYKPKYGVRDTSDHRIDYRPTIDWEPNVVTDASGEATIWFYTADKPSTYTVRVEGTDMRGHLAFKQSAIKVGEKEKAK